MAMPPVVEVRWKDDGRSNRVHLGLSPLRADVCNICRLPLSLSADVLVMDDGNGIHGVCPSKQRPPG